MDSTPFPVIDLVATGSNIQRLRQERGLTVRDLQRYFGFEEPRAIYKWQKGETLPTVDNLYALGILLEVPMDGILVPVKRHSAKEQRENRCSGVLIGAFRYDRARFSLHHLDRQLGRRHDGSCVLLCRRVDRRCRSACCPGDAGFSCMEEREFGREN